jgi:antitoxin YefM
VDVRPEQKDLALRVPVRDTVHMKTITYTAARENLADTMQRVCEDRDPVVITRRRDQAVVMMSMEDYASLEETAYLLRSPKNARRLRDAVDQLRSGKGTKHDLPEL